MPRKRKICPSNDADWVQPEPKEPKRSKKVQEASDLELGSILVDYNGAHWTLDSKFTNGTFGALYLGHLTSDTSRETHVIKIESISEGSLFQESVVYERLCRKDKIDKWKQGKQLDFLGVPSFVASGRHDAQGAKFRFLVLPKFGQSLEQKRQGRKSGKLPSTLVFAVAKQSLDALEYLAESGYVHGDLKAQNLVESIQDNQKFYLIDYGLSFKVPACETYQENPKVAHEGTPIFTSLDAHKGCTSTFRGDVEILGYNILFWLAGKLPWTKRGTGGTSLSKEAIMRAKEKFRQNPEAQLRKLLGNRRYMLYR